MGEDKSTCHAGIVIAVASLMIAAPAAAQSQKVGDPPEAKNMRLVGFRQILAVAHAHHLRAAVLVIPLERRNVFEVLRVGRIGHVVDFVPRLRAALNIALQVDFAGRPLTALGSPD